MAGLTDAQRRELARKRRGRGGRRRRRNREHVPLLSCRLRARSVSAARPHTIYYTLSTIAQTLASGLAVLVAIVLFNFNRANDALGNGKALVPEGQRAPPTR
jgi:hypothetical protein